MQQAWSNVVYGVRNKGVRLSGQELSPSTLHLPCMSMWKPRHLTAFERQPQTSTAQLYGVITTRAQLLTMTMNDNKHSSLDSEKGEAMLTRPSRPRSRPLFTGFALVAIFYLLWTFTPSFNVFHNLCAKQNIAQATISQSKRALVPLEAHIMSKCSDAKVGLTSNTKICHLTFLRIV